MKILAIDTSTKRGSIALAEGDRCVSEKIFNAEVTHTENLLPAIDAIFKQAGWRLADLNGLGMTIGPGSFTGLRIGLATMKAFARVHHLPLVGVSSLLALATSECLSDLPVAAIMDAKRGEVYAAVYAFSKGDVSKILLKEQAIKPEALSNALKSIGDCRLPGEDQLRASCVAKLAYTSLKKGEGKNWTSLTPNYLRLSDAEIKKEGR